MGRFNKCCCCDPNPPPKYLDNPTVVLQKADGSSVTVDIRTAFGGFLQPWQSCGGNEETDGCGFPLGRPNCGKSYNPTATDSTMISCGFETAPGNLTGQNVWTLNPAYKPQKKCQLPGWKGVAVRATWPGIFGFYDPGDGQCCPTLGNPQTKYRTAVQISSGSVTYAGKFYELRGANVGNSTGTAKYNLTATSSVDLFGNPTNSASISSSTKATSLFNEVSNNFKNIATVDLEDDCGLNGFNPGDAIGVAGYQTSLPAPSFPSVPLSMSSSSCGRYIVPAPTSQANNPSGGFTFIGTIDEINAVRLFNFDAYNSDPDFNYSGRSNQWGGTSSLSLVCVGSLVAFGDTERFGFTITGSSTWTQIDTDSTGAIVNQFNDSVSYDYEFSVSLSDPHTFADVHNDAAAIATAWNLGDDVVYPWRQDGETWLVPLVTRDAVSAGPTYPLSLGECTTPWTPSDVTTTSPDGTVQTRVITGARSGSITYNPSWSQYTGKLIGVPQSVDNDYCYNFSQSVQEICDLRSESGGCGVCQTGWGQWAAAPLPKTATQWTSLTDGNYCPVTGGSLVQLVAGEGLMLYKWAEILEAWPSVNLARPFGRDRFVVDYSAAPPDAVKNPTCVGGGNGIDARNYTPGASEICLDPTNYFYGYRKFPTCRAIGSVIGISSAVQTSPGVITLTTTEPHWLCGNGDGHGYTDKIDFYKIAGLGDGETVVTATPDSNTLTVAGTLDVTQPYTGGGFIASAGIMQDTAQWDYTCSRHQFVAQTWQTTYRQNGGTAYSEVQGTLAPVSGKPSVLLCSPNAESFPAGVPIYRLPFGNIAYESCFDPSQWHGAFLPAVADPFWLAPQQCSASESGTGSKLLRMQPSPCTDGPSETDTLVPITYYRFHPLVEPVIGLPAGAPGLAVGVTFGGPYGSGTTMPALAGDAGRLGSLGGCTANVATTQLVSIYSQYMACADWREMTHDHCAVNVQYVLPLASGFIQPPGNGQLAEPSGTGALPGADGGGLGI
jgi:hypothetical protein